MVALATCFVATGQNDSEGFLNDLRGNLDLGLGNKHWSYAEFTAFQPIVSNDNGLLALDMHYMTHFGDENSDSNEKSIGLIYRKLLNDGASFIGLNTSYSIYKTWDGNTRQTPHVGIEFVSNKLTLLANYMFQDETIHANRRVTSDYHPVYDLGPGLLHAGEAFTGGYEAVVRYSFSDKFALGVGYYSRFGDGEYEITEEIKGISSTTGELVTFTATSQVTNSYLLREGFFVDAEMATDIGTFSIQLKNDEQHEFLGMVAFRLPIGGASKKDLQNNYVKRKYTSTIYKADPDDFGIGLLVAGAIAAGAAEGTAAAAAGAVAADVAAGAAVGGLIVAANKN
jgi:hypothetical protein